MGTTGIVLPAHIRGDTFIYEGTLDDGWTAEQLSGGLKFTLRKRYPESDVVTDDDEDEDFVDQASGEIVASGTSVVVTIPASRTTAWPAGKLYWDLQGVISGATPRVYTIASGVISILPDVTRAL